MTDYTAPLDDIRFALTELANLDQVAALPGYEEATPDLVGNVLGPLNRSGDIQGSRLVDGVVHTPDGFPEAFKAFADGGWIGLSAPLDMGGQGLPKLIAVAVEEMWQAANMGFAVGPLLTQAAIDLLVTHGTAEQRETYLAKLISGQWTGTMNLTESHAGSDLGEIRTRAERHGDHYRIKGQKIFITYGDHDLAENIIHMVLARSPDGIPGIKGISLYIVPKMLVNDDDSLGGPNEVRCASLEHKLGINASPTAVMLYGENDGATAYLVGEENRGIEYMFLMMNQARVGVGVQGLAIAERAYQGARAYARERVQGTTMSDPRGERKAIINHPDVRRMLLGMKARIEAARGLIYYTAAALDRANHHPDEATRSRAGLIADLLVPVAKAWSTDIGVEVASDAIQVHGGMGFIEETGAAQHYRDARIAPIYEGTNGIQANDLLRRKLMRDKGAAARDFIAEMAELDAPLSQTNDADLAAIRARLKDGIEALGQATDWLVTTFPEQPELAAAGAVPYLRLFGTVTGGWQMARAGLAARRRLDSNGSDGAASNAKLTTARFYADQVLGEAPALARVVTEGGASVMALHEDQF
jgi:alkylation response protein AidB-like acyl-CoA dehydrogenase